MVLGNTVRITSTPSYAEHLVGSEGVVIDIDEDEIASITVLLDNPKDGPKVWATTVNELELL